MKKQSFDQKSIGTSVIERMEGKTLDVAVTDALTTFKPLHARLLTAVSALDDACQRRDAALAAVGEADALLDDKVELRLANALVSAGLTKRNRPFAGFSKLAPSAMVDLGCLKELVEVRELIANVAKAAPPEELTSILGECLQQASKVEQAIDAVRPYQHAYDLALAARDEASIDWTKGFCRLKARSEECFEEKPEVFKAIFGEPSRFERKTARRAKKEAKPTDPPAEPE